MALAFGGKNSAGTPLTGAKYNPNQKTGDQLIDEERQKAEAQGGYYYDKGTGTRQWTAGGGGAAGQLASLSMAGVGGGGGSYGAGGGDGGGGGGSASASATASLPPPTDETDFVQGMAGMMRPSLGTRRPAPPDGGLRALQRKVY